MGFTKALVFIALLVIKMINAQNSIAGNATDQSKEPLVFANVILYKTDTAILAMATGEKGECFFENIKAGSHRIEVSMLGFDAEISETFSFSNKNEAKGFSC